jgi:hypothetical protein
VGAAVTGAVVDDEPCPGAHRGCQRWRCR